MSLIIHEDEHLLYFLTSYLFSLLSLFNLCYFSKTFACFLMSCKSSLLCTLAHCYLCDNVVSWLFLWYLSLCMILNSYEVNLSVFFFMISIMYCFKRSIPYIFTFKHLWNILKVFFGILIFSVYLYLKVNYCLCFNINNYLVGCLEIINLVACTYMWNWLPVFE